MKSKYDENNPYDGLSPADALQILYDIHNENPDDKGGIREILPDGRIGQKLIDLSEISHQTTWLIVLSGELTMDYYLRNKSATAKICQMLLCVHPLPEE